MNSEQLNHHNSIAFLFIVHFRPFFSFPFPGNLCRAIFTIIAMFKEPSYLRIVPFFSLTTHYTESVLTNWRCFLHLDGTFSFGQWSEWKEIILDFQHRLLVAQIHLHNIWQNLNCGEYESKLKTTIVIVFWFIPEPIFHIGCLSSSNSYECTQ